MLLDLNILNQRPSEHTGEQFPDALSNGRRRHRRQRTSTDFPAFLLL